jgi:hypothetical protein
MGRLINTDDLMRNICKEYDQRAEKGQGLKLAWIEKAVNDTPDADLTNTVQLYKCNGLKPDCKKTACYFLGNGECMLTTDERYAIR